VVYRKGRDGNSSSPGFKRRAGGAPADVYLQMKKPAFAS
jgi:hypothetical protein